MSSVAIWEKLLDKNAFVIQPDAVLVFKTLVIPLVISFRIDVAIRYVSLKSYTEEIKSKVSKSVHFRTVVSAIVLCNIAFALQIRSQGLFDSNTKTFTDSYLVWSIVNQGTALLTYFYIFFGALNRYEGIRPRATSSERQIKQRGVLLLALEYIVLGLSMIGVLMWDGTTLIRGYSYHQELNKAVCVVSLLSNFMQGITLICFKFSEKNHYTESLTLYLVTFNLCFWFMDIGTYTKTGSLTDADEGWQHALYVIYFFCTIEYRLHCAKESACEELNEEEEAGRAARPRSSVADEEDSIDRQRSRGSYGTMEPV